MCVIAQDTHKAYKTHKAHKAHSTHNSAHAKHTYTHKAHTKHTQSTHTHTQSTHKAHTQTTDPGESVPVLIKLLPEVIVFGLHPSVSFRYYCTYTTGVVSAGSQTIRLNFLFFFQTIRLNNVGGGG